jgi:beta-glucosidase
MVLNFKDIESDSNFPMQFMGSSNLTKLIDELTSQVKRKFIPMSRIDDAVKRILRVKFTMGLFENPIADHSLAKKLGSKVCKIKKQF